MGASDHLSPGQFPGASWRQALPAEHEAILRRWEKDPRAVPSQDRAAFRKIVPSAPVAQGSVYRGTETLSAPHWIMPLDRQVEHYRSMIGTGQTIRFPRFTAASSLPEVASGFGRTVYEIEGHEGRHIGNGLHEAVLPPSSYEVTGAERGTGRARAPIDARTMFNTEQVRVKLRRAT
jgi:hypothetical protein